MNVNAAVAFVAVVLTGLLLQCVPSSIIFAQSAAERRDTAAASRLDTLPVSPGARIRLQLDDRPGWDVGVLHAQGSGRVLMSRCQTCGADEINVRQITAAQVSQGLTSSHIVGGAVVGALIGTVVGVTLVNNSIQNTHPCDGCGLKILAVPQFTAGGFFIGAVIGAMLRQERWGSLPLRQN